MEEKRWGIFAIHRGSLRVRVSDSGYMVGTDTGGSRASWTDRGELCVLVRLIERGLGVDGFLFCTGEMAIHTHLTWPLTDSVNRLRRLLAELS
jgi:hypothetical protein